MTFHRKIFFTAICIVFAFNVNIIAQTEPLELNPEQTIRKLYHLLSPTKGQTPDWEKVSDCFNEEAVIVLRSSKTSSSTFSKNGFVADFQKFFKDANVIKTGFLEKIIHMKSVVFGDIASISVIYEASFPGSKRAPQAGVDLIHLIQKDNKWLITSIVNEVPFGENKIPKILFE